MMTLNEQRIAIAEWMGWNDISFRVDFDGWYGWKDKVNAEQTAEIPNYPLDLNAMYEAESKLDNDQKWKYTLKLSSITTYKYGNTISASTTFADAAQRSEALCRILWPERF